MKIRVRHLGGETRELDARVVGTKVFVRWPIYPDLAFALATGKGIGPASTWTIPKEELERLRRAYASA